MKHLRLKLKIEGGGLTILPGESYGQHGSGQTIDGDPWEKGRQKLKNNINPFGNRGYKVQGIKRIKDVTTKPKVSPAQLAKALEARELKELCQKQGKLALKVLNQILNDPNAADMAKIAAIHAIWDRGYGKPTQMNVTAMVNADGPPSEIDDQELTERINTTLRRIEAASNGAGKQAESPKRPADLRKLN